MKGRVQRHGPSWRYVVDVGEQPRQRCASCGRVHWADRKRIAVCAACGGRMLDEGLRRRQKTQSGYATQREAQRALNKAIGAIDDGRHVSPDKLTLKQYIEDEWLPTIRAGTRKATTVQLYETMLTKYVLPRVGAVLLQRLVGRDITRLYAELREDGRTSAKHPGGLSEYTIANVDTALGMALRDAVTMQVITRTPMADVVGRPSPPDTRENWRTWSGEEVHRFLESVHEDRLYPLYVFMATTGVRRGEACGLRWQDVDMGVGVASIINTIVLVDNRPVDAPPKSKSSRRPVPLDPAVVAILETWRERQDAEQDEAGDAWRGGGYVFTWQDGAPIRPDYLTNDFRKAVKRSKLPSIRLHDLRHSFATIGFSAGMHPRTMAAQLGHGDTSVTMATYSHVLPALQRQAAEDVAGAILGAQTPACDHSRDHEGEDGEDASGESAD